MVSNHDLGGDEKQSAIYIIRDITLYVQPANHTASMNQSEIKVENKSLMAIGYVYYF